MLEIDEGFAQLLGDFAVRRKVNLIVLQNSFVNQRLEKIVNIVAAEVGISIGGENLIDVTFFSRDEFEDGNIERAAAEVIDGYFATLLLVKAVSQRRRRRLID